MIELKLPWPPSALSPNARGYWAKKASAAKQYRRDCWVCALGQKADYQRAFHHLGAGKLTMELVFHPPHLRKSDLDNLIARMKSGLDGVFDAFGTDDSIIGQIVSSKSAPKRRGLVIVCFRDGGSVKSGYVKSTQVPIWPEKSIRLVS